VDFECNNFDMIFSTFFKHAPLGILISDHHGEIILCNPWITNLLGYKEQELIGKNLDLLLPEKSKLKWAEYRYNHSNASQHPPVSWNIDLDIITQNGTVHSVEVDLFDYETPDGRQTVSFINHMTGKKGTRTKLERIAMELESRVNDRTKELSEALIELNFAHNNLEKEVEQRKEAELMILSSLEKEKELNELKSRFVCMASHEFRTPLTGILTSASLLYKHHEAGNTENVKRHVTIIKKSVKSLTSILNEFLSLDKLDQGIIDPQISTFNLKSLLQEVVEEMLEYSEKGHEVIIKHQEEDLILTQDKEMVRNILINLISNAIKYSPAKSVIHFDSQIVHSKVVLNVKDSGIGIPKADQKHIFQRFFRANNANTIQGTGLGLNIVKGYLDLMGGHISFSSQENIGSTFTVTLPQEKK